MAIGRYQLHQKNASGTYDDVYFKTESGLIVRPSGRTVEQDLAAYLPEVQDSDTVPQSLAKGKVKLGNTKAWMGGSKVIELTKDTVYTHPSSKQCSYTYSHPSTKQCTGGDCNTLSGYTYSQILNNAASATPSYTSTTIFSNSGETSFSCSIPTGYQSYTIDGGSNNGSISVSFAGTIRGCNIDMSGTSIVSASTTDNYVNLLSGTIYITKAGPIWIIIGSGYGSSGTKCVIGSTTYRPTNASYSGGRYTGSLYVYGYK